MAAPHIDVSRYPIVVVRYAAMVGSEDVAALLQALEPVYERGTREQFYSIADLSEMHLDNIGPQVRQPLSVGLNELDRRFPNAKAGEVVVTQESFVRGAYYAINLVRPRVPYKRVAVATLEEALQWVQQQRQAAR